MVGTFTVLGVLLMMCIHFNRSRHHTGTLHRLWKATAFSLLFCTVLLDTSLTFAQNKKKPVDIMYAGTFSRNGSKGIYVLQLDRGHQRLNTLQTVDEKRNPSFIALHPNGKTLYSIYGEGLTPEDKRGTVMSFRIDQQTGFLKKLNEQSSEGKGPAHVSVDPKGRFIYVANYGEGNFAIYPLLPNGTIAKAKQVIQFDGSGFDTALQKHPFVHSVFPSADGKFIYVSALGLDKILIYQVRDKSDFMPAATPFASSKPGSGPRHFIIHPNGKVAFSAEEVSATVASYKRDPATGALTSLERFALVPDTVRGRTSAADIHLSPDGNFLYASVRGSNKMAIYSVDKHTGKLTFVSLEDGHGDHPRNFLVDKKGDFVFVENMRSDNIAIFQRDRKTGHMQFLRTQEIPGPECLIQR